MLIQPFNNIYMDTILVIVILFVASKLLRFIIENFVRVFTRKTKTKLDDLLQSTGEDIDGRQYLAICYRRFSFNILIFSVVFTSLLGLFRITNFFIFGMTG